MVDETVLEHRSLVVRVTDGCVYVPSSTEFLTTYVLLEQEDWFEKEMAFVRRLLQPGMRVVDVGANYGLYTLAMGRSVGASGYVWAFEPAAATLRFLRKTIEVNGLSSVVTCAAALSDHAGDGFLGTQRNSELNSLVTSPGPGTEAVSLTTLDAEWVSRGMGDVDFLKLDAEGEELRIVGGGRRFFAETSPLVMFELKAGAEVNVELPHAFRSLGYGIYRLVGPDVLLVPVDAGDPFDAFELNLFACKRDRAVALARRGLLVDEPNITPACMPGSGKAFWQAQTFSALWPRELAADDCSHDEWADHYSVWRDRNNSASQRFASLKSAVRLLATHPHGGEDLNAAANRARLLLEAGARQEAVQAIAQVLTLTTQGAEIGRGVVWPICSRYDDIRPVGPIRDWLVASAIEAHAAAAQFSDYFTRSNYLQALDWLQSTAYATAAIERRRQLQSIRAGRQTGLVPSPLLKMAGPGHLNPQLWGGGP